jgi:polyisoprenoid-binding protein YceI
MRLSRKAAVAVLGLGILVLPSSARAADFNIDPFHSSISFRIKHVIGKVTGHFDKFTGSFTYEENKPQAWSAMATIEAISINTGIEKRDNHLRSPDFFDVQKFPTLVFKSTGITDVEGNKAKLHGDLTIHGVTKPIVLDLEVAGTVKDPMGQGMRAGAKATGHVNRLDYGVGPSAGPLAGMVGKDVEITIETEGVSK